MLSDTECRHPPTHSEANTNTHIHTQKQGIANVAHFVLIFPPAPVHLRIKRVLFIWRRACTVSVCLSLIITKCKPADSVELLSYDTWLLIHAFIICNSTEQQKRTTSNYWKNTIVSSEWLYHQSALRMLSLCSSSKEPFFFFFFGGHLWCCNLAKASAGPRGPDLCKSTTHPAKARHIYHSVS